MVDGLSNAKNDAFPGHLKKEKTPDINLHSTNRKQPYTPARSSKNNRRKDTKIEIN